MKTGLFSLAMASTALAAALPDEHKMDRRQVLSSATDVLSSLVPTSTSASMSMSASAPSASGSGPASALISGLNAAGLTTLASLLAMDPQASQLADMGNLTVFAPSNDAFDMANLDTSNMTAVQEILSYHITQGYYPVAQIPANGTHIIVPTLQGEPVAFYMDQFGTTNVIGQNATVMSNATVGNVLVKAIDQVLMIPGPIPSVLNMTASGAGLAGLAAMYLPDIITTLNDTSMNFTVFAPTTDAIQSVMSTLAPLVASNMDAVVSLVQGHVLDQVVYSTNITDGLSAMSLNGMDLMLSVTNTTGNATVTVMANGGNATVVATDYIASNGVIHFIDSVLYNPMALASSMSSSMMMSATASA